MGLKQKTGLCTLLSLGILYEIGTLSFAQYLRV